VNIGPTHRLWDTACRVVGLPELADDPRFATQTLRAKNHLELSRLFQEAFLAKESEEWIEAFQKAGIPTGPIKTVAEVLDGDPHAEAREMVVEVDHATIGRMKTLGIPVKLSETPGAVRRAAPLLGQHNDEVLAEVGYSAEEIASLRADGVIG
jgi:formyl-CoA transferase